MGKLLMTAAVLVALPMPAMAFIAAPADPPLGSAIYLTCKPPPVLPPPSNIQEAFWALSRQCEI
jgi:hypothetical protein